MATLQEAADNLKGLNSLYQKAREHCADLKGAVQTSQQELDRLAEEIQEAERRIIELARE